MFLRPTFDFVNRAKRENMQQIHLRNGVKPNGKQMGIKREKCTHNVIKKTRREKKPVQLRKTKRERKKNYYKNEVKFC